MDSAPTSPRDSASEDLIIDMTRKVVSAKRVKLLAKVYLLDMLTPNFTYRVLSTNAIMVVRTISVKNSKIFMLLEVLK